MNRLIAARPIFRSMVQRNFEPMKRMMSSEYEYEDIGPPASFNQLPQPEGSWQENFQKKQAKYNTIMGASAAFLVGTLAFVISSEIIFFNAAAPDTYE